MTRISDESVRAALMKTLAADRGAMVELTRELVAIPSENPPGVHYADAIELLTTRLRELGFEDTRVEGD